MGNPGACYRSVTIQALTVFSLVAFFGADHVHGGNDGCPLFSCGHLQNISYPFRRRGDPVGCGSEAYELVCTSSKATIQINTGTYYVTAINYTNSYFWVMDPNYDTNSSCPLPLWNHLPYSYNRGKLDSHGFWNLDTRSYFTACFANCSRAVTNNSAYKPVACLSAGNSHVYVSVDFSCSVANLEPYCGYLAMIPFGEETPSHYLLPQNASHVDITELIKKGFTVRFPVRFTRIVSVSLCLNDSISFFKEEISNANIVNVNRAFFWSDTHFFKCVLHRYYNGCTVLFVLAAIATPKFLFVLCRFLLAPLAIWTFLVYKYWKTKITVDAVENFLWVLYN